MNDAGQLGVTGAALLNPVEAVTNVLKPKGHNDPIVLGYQLVILLHFL